jgi:serine protease
MMFSINPNLSPDDVRNAILLSRKAWSTTTGLPACTSVLRGHCQCDTNTCGAGILDAAAALNYARNTAVPTDGNLVSLLGGRTALPAGTVNANYQTDRGSSSTRQRSGGGGGGAVEPAWLLGLALAVGVLASAGRRG